MRKSAAIFLLLVTWACMANAWDGYDYEQGAAVEIGKGNLVRVGRDIEIYDYEDGAYKEVTVESIRRVGRVIEIEVTEVETGKSRTLEMDGK